MKRFIDHRAAMPDDSYRLRRDADPASAHWWTLYDPAGKAIVSWNHKPEKEQVQNIVAQYRQEATC